MNPLAPLVSVVAPVYNGELYLSAALESILAQRYQPVEVIVVDDGSSDSSESIARSYPGIRYLRQENQGVAAARNAGVAAARGEFLAFLDQDDLWEPDKLGTQVQYLQEHPEAPYVLCRLRMFLEPGLEKPDWIPARYLETEISAFLLGALLVRRQVFERVGGFDTAYRFASDHDWFARSQDAGLQVTVLPQALLRVRIHRSNQSAQVQGIIAEALRMVRASIRRKRL